MQLIIIKKKPFKSKKKNSTANKNFVVGELFLMQKNSSTY